MGDIFENPVRPNLDGESRAVTWSRVALVDLNRHWGWLSPRLQERHPHATEGQIVRYLRANLDSDNADLIANEGGVALFAVERRTSSCPTSRSSSVFATPRERCDFAEALYGPAADWARRLGIADFVYARHSDAGAEFAARREARALGQQTDKTQSWWCRRAGKSTVRHLRAGPQPHLLGIAVSVLWQLPTAPMSRRGTSAVWPMSERGSRRTARGLPKQRGRGGGG